MTGMAPPAIAPAVNWPSAPMFQRLARKQTARPDADKHQRRGLHDELLDRPHRRHRLDEVDVERLQRVEPARGEDHGSNAHREPDGDDRGERGHRLARLRDVPRAATS